ncbi:hypothetical protein TNCV_2354061 [Trichonephila clavipes]|nr:hypothetical protein TNCV_2354061 [Trichonephila clavipes]
MQNGSKPSIQMVYEACLRAERLSLPERPAQRPERMSPTEPERIPTPPAQRPEKIPTPPVEPERIPTPPVETEIPAEPERPPMEMADPSVFMDNVEVTTPLITRCDKGTQTISPYLHVNASILERGAWNNHRPIKDSNRNPRRFQTTLFCVCLEIILSCNWVTMDSLFNSPM